MVYTEQIYKDIEEIQNIINEKGLSNLNIVQDIMSVSKPKIDSTINYYKNIAGKYLKRVNSDTHVINYYYIHENIKQYVNWDGKPTLDVVVDNYSFNIHENSFYIYSDTKHVLSSPYINRYSDCCEISKEDFDKDMSQINILIQQAQEIYNKLA